MRLKRRCLRYSILCVENDVMIDSLYCSCSFIPNGSLASSLDITGSRNKQIDNNVHNHLHKTTTNKIKIEYLSTSGASIGHIYCTSWVGSWWHSPVGRLLHRQMYRWLCEGRNRVHKYKEMPLYSTVKGLFIV